MCEFFWNEYIQRKRQGQTRKRPIADILIAAFSRRFQRLITCNEVDFHNIDAGLNLYDLILSLNWRRTG